MAYRRAFPKDVVAKAQISARVPASTRDRLQERASANGRSISCELEHIIEQTLTAADVAVAFREEFARYRAETSVMPNMRDEDRAEWLRH